MVLSQLLGIGVPSTPITQLWVERIATENRRWTQNYNLPHENEKGTRRRVKAVKLHIRFIKISWLCLVCMACKTSHTMRMSPCPNMHLTQSSSISTLGARSHPFVYTLQSARLDCQNHQQKVRWYVAAPCIASAPNIQPFEVAWVCMAGWHHNRIISIHLDLEVFCVIPRDGERHVVFVCQINHPITNTQAHCGSEVEKVLRAWPALWIVALNVVSKKSIIATALSHTHTHTHRNESACKS